MTVTRAQNIARRYGLALGLGVATAIVQARLGSLVGETSLFFVLPAVVGAAWFGGFGPGALAAIVPFVVRASSVGLSSVVDANKPADIVAVGLVVLTTLLVCMMMRRLRGYARDERRQRIEVEWLLRRATVVETLATTEAAARTAAEVASASASVLMREMGASTGAVALIPAEGGDAEVVQAFGYENAIAGRIDLTSGGAVATSLRRGEVVAMSQTHPNAASDTPTLLTQHEVLVMIPLAVSGRTLGVVALGFNEPRVFESRECQCLLETGHLTAQALERARAYDRAEQARADGEAYRVRAEAEIRERRRAEAAHQESEARYRTLAARTHRLYSLSAALSEAVTLDAVARTVVRQGRGVVGAAAGAVALCVDDDAFETLYAEEYPPPVVEASRRFSAESGLCTTAAVASRHAVFVRSFAEWQQQYPRSAATAADGGFTSAASLPLLVDNLPIGVLSFHFTVPVNFDPDYQALLTSVAHHAAQAIDRARLYETTQRARVDAETANRAKDDFLSIVSHELRTPLNAILGWGTMLRDGSLDASRVQRATDAIVSNATRQARLIDDLLEVSRMVAGRVSLDLQQLELADIVRGAVEAMLPTAAQRGIELQTDDLPRARVVADPHRLEQVFGNLLTNALKFTPAGGRVTVAGALDDGEVQVRVSDTGCGIEPDVLPHIFERFRQGNNTTTRSVGGLGLGLFIVRRLVEVLHGQIVATSAGKDMGATFTVTLPVVAASVPEQSSSSDADRTEVPVGAARRLMGIHVLVVDDEPDVRELISAALDNSGATVTVVESAKDVIATLMNSDTRIDVLLADLAMPEEDGYSMIRRIRAHPDPLVAHIPAAAVTACARQDECLQAREAGFHLHLAKPFAPGALVEAVERLRGYDHCQRLNCAS